MSNSTFRVSQRNILFGILTFLWQVLIWAPWIKRIPKNENIWEKQCSIDQHINTAMILTKVRQKNASRKECYHVSNALERSQLPLWRVEGANHWRTCSKNSRPEQTALEKLTPFLSNTRTEFSPFDQHIPNTSALHVQGISKLTALLWRTEMLK
jgi:hypothetical protein